MGALALPRAALGNCCLTESCSWCRYGGIIKLIHILNFEHRSVIHLSDYRTCKAVGEVEPNRQPLVLRELLSVKKSKHGGAVNSRRMCHVVERCRAALLGSRQIVPLPRSTLGSIMCLPRCSFCRESCSKSLIFPSARVLALGEQPDTRCIQNFQ